MTFPPIYRCLFLLSIHLSLASLADCATWVNIRINSKDQYTKKASGPTATNVERGRRGMVHSSAFLGPHHRADGNKVYVRRSYYYHISHIPRLVADLPH